ncbi:uncharacterized protein LY89DRAFT_740846 [Mollisia scopiformis]|uniref:Uncharacterized protein n=1 Tax=Mollisia scopiformis TaxID=149040 RepID=A0A132BBK4_MOLSC|nr:uncharacterized protein LY89DRAFT_740846 [Mollisia scopiformis]KUJ09776.1 hypothetical protein LY89DRAFT_740846 [Mollisia scopiformis]
MNADFMIFTLWLVHYDPTGNEFKYSWLPYLSRHKEGSEGLWRKTRGGESGSQGQPQSASSVDDAHCWTQPLRFRVLMAKVDENGEVQERGGNADAEEEAEITKWTHLDYVQVFDPLTDSIPGNPAHRPVYRY